MGEAIASHGPAAEQAALPVAQGKRGERDQQHLHDK